MKHKLIPALVFAALQSAGDSAFSQDLPELLRKGRIDGLTSGTPTKVELVGDRLIVEMPAPPPPRIEIPIRQVQCDGHDFSDMFFVKCYSGKCMLQTTSISSKPLESEIQMFRLPDKLAVAAAEACRQLQNALGGVITK